MVVVVQKFRGRLVVVTVMLVVVGRLVVVTVVLVVVGRTAGAQSRLDDRGVTSRSPNWSTTAASGSDRLAHFTV
jgi:hypothetical protein